jgi:CRP-like cAMP-binding protein
MESDDQPRLPSGPLYRPQVAFEFFMSAGRSEKFAAGKRIFKENQKGIPFLLMPNKMYLLVDGEVDLVARGKPITTIHRGEVFGEMAAIGQTRRSASAIAKSACRVLSMDDRQFQRALKKRPEFSLALMSVMIGRLRQTLGRLGGAGALGDEPAQAHRAFDKSLLKDLVQRFGGHGELRYNEGKVILREGQAGVLVYVVLEGSIAISIQGKVVETIGPGGVFGEMAVIERMPRAASATAETDCLVLAIDNKMFLGLIKSSRRFGVSLLSAVSERAKQMTARYA